MECAKSYRTKQRELIMKFLINNKEKHIIAEDVVEHLKEEGNAVGKSTVYRYLDKLVQDGTVRKFFLEEGMGACYQYAEDENCNTHYHFKCTVCGKLFHVECDELNEIYQHIFKNHRFQLNLSKTVLYGICEKCLEK